MIVSFFISKSEPPFAIDTDISIVVSAEFSCRPPGHRLKWVLRCSVYSKTFKTCRFPLYFIYRHFSRIALAIIWCWFFQHSLIMIKVSGLWLLAAGDWFLAAAEGCATFGHFWLTSTFRNPQSFGSVI